MLWITTWTTQFQAFHLDLHDTSTWLGTAWFSRLGLDFLGPSYPLMLKALDPFYHCLLILRAIGFFYLLFSFSFFFFIFFAIFSQALYFSLLFLASRINFMIFQIINNIFRVPHPFRGQYSSNSKYILCTVQAFIQRTKSIATTYN